MHNRKDCESNFFAFMSLALGRWIRVTVCVLLIQTLELNPDPSHIPMCAADINPWHKDKHYLAFILTCRKMEVHSQ